MPRQSFSAFARELEAIEPRLEQAFLEAVQDIKSSARLRTIELAIEQGNIQAVFDALRLDDSFFALLDRQIDEAYLQGGLWQISQLPKKAGPEGAKLVVRFDQRNPRAERWTRERAGRLITEITEDTRSAIRSEVLEGISKGEGASVIAKRLIGVQSGNQRTGGIIGLHSRDAEAVRKAREELSDPATLRAYMRRGSGPNKYPPGGRTVLSAIKAERALTRAEIAKITRGYENRLLKVRGLRIARTEAHAAFMAGRFEATQQMIDSGRVPASAIDKIWQATPDRRTRDPHRSMNGQRRKWNKPFDSPTGAQLMYPSDSSLGATGADIINCRCGFRADIDFTQLAV